MNRILLVLLCALPFFSVAQRDWAKLCKKSHETFAYRIPADSAEKYIKQDSIPVDVFLSQKPSFVFKTDSLDKDGLPKGHFVLLSIIDNKIEAELIGITDLVIYPLLNEQVHIVEVRNRQGAFIADAKVWVNGKLASYDKDAMNYHLQQKKLPEDPLIKVYAAGDTSFLSFDYQPPRPSVAKQKWQLFKRKKLGSIITWIPRKISNLLHGRKYHKYKSNSIGASGYVVFNQPKYKLTDTVKLKAYIVNKKWKQYNEKVNVYLIYYARGENQKQLLTTLKPHAPGSFIYEFPLNDTLVNDITYTIEFETTDSKKRVLASSFLVEDYLLDEVAHYSFRSEKDEYYKGDSMLFYASAKDANDLPLLDAKAKLILLNSSVDSYEKDSIYVADTLYAEEKTMLTQSDTKFTVPGSFFPSANQHIRAVLQFKNSNNEIQYKEVDVNWALSNSQLRVKIIADTVYATYYKNGIATSIDGELDIDGESNIEQNLKVHYPFKIKIDALAQDYDFYILEKGKVIASAFANIQAYYEVGFSRISVQDTAGFTLSNPYKIPVNYLVFDGNKIIATGKSSDANITWMHKIKNRRKLYTLKYDYVWKGKAVERNQSIGLLYKILNIRINANSQVFPGQKDSVTIDVKDYKGKPVANVNMVAASYNSQFKNNIHVPEPPYLAKYKQRPTWRRGFYKIDDNDVYFKSSYLLGNHQQWRQQFGMDSLLYYQMLFPEKLLDIATYNKDFMPQLSVHVVHKGQPQPIYLLYLNRQLVYYDGTTVKMQDSYQANNYYTQLGIRLLDKYIELDSVYVQPNYKHDIVLDLDKLPTAAKVFDKPKFYEATEKSVIENSIWQLDNRFGNLYVWQDWRVAIVGNPTYGYYNYAPHLVGPFRSTDSMHFFLPRSFDSHFKFEPGYIYNLSNKILRLEKNTIFKPLSKNAQYNLPIRNDYKWTTLGDTLQTPPIIEYPQVYQPYLEYTSYRGYYDYMPQKAGNGKLEFIVPIDTSLHYIVLLQKDTNARVLVLQPHTRKVKNIVPGTYELLLVNYKWQTAALTVSIKKDTTLYIKTNNYEYKLNNSIIDSLLAATIAKNKPVVKPKEQNLVIEEKPLVAIAKGNAIIQGIVKDEKGANPIPNASVTIKGSTTGTLCNVHGQFALSVKPGIYTLLIASVGYVHKELKVEAVEGDSKSHTVLLSPASQSLDDVVVVGYGVSKRQSVTGYISTISAKELTSVSRLENALMGKVPGLQVTNDSETGTDAKLMLRGAASNLGNKPLYIIDGIAYDEIPKSITPEMMGSIEVLKDASATAIYGSRAADGVVIISTKTKTLRTQFRDYAFWQPEFFTDKNGKAGFTVTYPDNITSWETYVLGMDKKRRMGRAVTFTRSFKPVMAQLSVPQFLIEGDDVQFIGKVVNYTNDSYNVKTSFSIQDKLTDEKDISVAGSASAIAALNVIADADKDTLKAKFQLQTSTGFNDGEERKIPVFKKGTEEATGQFWILNQDTTISFKADKQAVSIEVVAQNNTLNVLLDEIDHLKKYPYYCMEQTASKLRGLILEKKIRETLNEPFKNEKEMNQLLTKLQKAQHFDGGWSWWETGNADLYITNYIINALLPLRGNVLVETNIRNGLLYLQNQLPNLKRGRLLATLSTMAAANHAINYTDYLSKIAFDSLSLHEQWQYVKIKQHLKIDYSNELDSLLKQAVPGMLGGLHWGIENYRWYSNANATTVVAYDVLRNDEQHKPLTNNIVQYFLEQRRNGYWRNTVESANILATILPDVLNANKAFQQPAQLNISGDTSFIVSSFPFKKTIGKNNQSLQVQKSGGGITYLTMYQKIWNTRPLAVTDNFEIKTYFEKTGQPLLYIKSGERMKMIITVDVKKDADYVMLEIPIPAGCTYAAKKQDNWNMHKEFLKNKVLLFADQLNKGIHTFEIELEPRYNGRFTLNPAKVELMYFPTFFGRNEMKEIDIKEQ